MRIATLFCGTLLAGASFAQPTPCDELNAGFAWNQSPNGIQFSNSTTGTGEQTTWFWSFGDGGTSSLAQPYHTYEAPGTYEVCLYAISIHLNGQAPLTCVDTACAAIVVEGNDPCADLSACFVVNDLGNGDFFFDNCSGPGADLQFKWFFGDGAISTASHADHHYEAPGTYEVCLYVFSLDCVDTLCTSVVVTGDDPCSDFHAHLTYQVDPVGSGTIAFAGDVPNGADFLWTFGDGALNDDALQGTHTYSQPGTYELCLTAWSFPPGSQTVCADTTCALVTIEGDDPCQDLQACFVPSGAGPMAFFFNNCSSFIGDAQFIWAFGDGTTANAVAPTHTYNEPGTYEVCLHVISIYESPNGPITCTAETCSTVVVQGQGGCDPGFAVAMAWNAGQDNVVFFNATSNHAETYFIWYFGDGTEGYGPQATHTYAAPGNYQVCVAGWYYNAASGDSCWAEDCAMINVGGGGDPCLQLEAGFVWTSGPNGVLFSNATTGTGFQTTWSWTFGDGSTSNDAQPFHTYNEPGTYEVCLHVISIYESPNGPITCTAETCSTVVVQGQGGCDPGFAVAMAWNAGQDNVVFFNATSNHAETHFIWYFGDGTEGYGPQATHTYAAPGAYQVCVAGWYYNAASGDSCWAEDCAMIVIGEGQGCDPNYVVDFAWFAQGNAVVLTATSNHPSAAYYWQFGDGTADWAGATVTHLYEPPGPYTVCVTAWYWEDASQDTCWADHCDWVSPFSTGLGEATADLVQVHPVPAHDWITVSGIPARSTLSLFSPDGRLVRSMPSTSTMVNMQLSGLASGAYVLQIEGPGTAIRRKVILE